MVRALETKFLLFWVGQEQDSCPAGRLTGKVRGYHTRIHPVRHRQTHGEQGETRQAQILVLVLPRSRPIRRNPALSGLEIGKIGPAYALAASARLLLFLTSAHSLLFLSRPWNIATDRLFQDHFGVAPH